MSYMKISIRFWWESCDYLLAMSLLNIIINNLFNKEYCNQALGNQLIPSMPRNFMLSASYTL